MAPLLSSLALALSLWALLSTPTHSLKCTSQKLPGNKGPFATCVDLPTLNAYLHYTYNAANSSMDMAFSAPPTTDQGWVSWAVNTKGSGMAGAQAIVALMIDGALAARTYSIISYEEIEESNLAFETWDLSAESDSASGYITVFASIKVPSQKFNHLWQVGPSATDEVPDMHQMKPANLGSRGLLELQAGGAAPSSSLKGTSQQDAAAVIVKAVSPAAGDSDAAAAVATAANSIANSPSGAAPVPAHSGGRKVAGAAVGVVCGVIGALGAFVF